MDHFLAVQLGLFFGAFSGAFASCTKSFEKSCCILRKARASLKNSYKGNTKMKDKYDIFFFRVRSTKSSIINGRKSFLE